MIFRLNKRLIFPDPALAEPDGLLAVGGDLSTKRLLLAYQQGIFPWYSDETPILWYSPPERCVLYPDKIKIAKSMKRVVSTGTFRVTTNTCFAEVIIACSKAPRSGQDGTWITQQMIAAYVELNRLGYAHSVEVWDGDELAGGLYGVAVNNIFCGESMFSRVSNASKMALIHICTSGGYRLIDCQMPTGHLLSLGAEVIGRDEYLALFKNKNF